MFRPWLEIARLSNLPTAWSNMLAAWILAGGKWEWRPLAWLLVGGSLLYTGGMILNDAADVRYDRTQRPERPIPSGKIAAWQAWAVGLLGMAGGAAMMVLGAHACIWLTGALVVAILFYDLFHKPWSGSVFVMGSCRTLLFLAAADAGADTFDVMANWEIEMKAIALGAYIVGLSLMARHESSPKAENKRLPLLAIVGFAFPLLAAIVSMAVHRNFWPLPFGVILFIIMKACVKVARTPPPPNIGRSVGILLACIVVVDGLAVSHVSLLAAVVMAACAPLLRLWQRVIAAT
jgi:4-hydroxybenzoate polyprenyltransferase